MPRSDWPGSQIPPPPSSIAKALKAPKRGASIDPPGDDAGKRSRARSGTSVDTQGLSIDAIVHAADIQDRDGGVFVMATISGIVSVPDGTLRRWRLSRPVVRRAVAKLMARVNVDRQAFRSRNRHCRPPEAAGRRTNVRMARALQVSRQDLGYLNHKALAFLCLASIRLMLRDYESPQNLSGQTEGLAASVHDACTHFWSTLPIFLGI